MYIQKLRTSGKDATKRNNPTVGVFLLVVFYITLSIGWLTKDTHMIISNGLSIFLMPLFTFPRILFVVKSYDQPYSLVELFGKMDFNLAVKVIMKLIVMNLLVGLWFLLLIVPGIIKGFAYALVPYIAIEQPELSIMDTLKLSEKMMKGRKFDLFTLGLSFFGWALLTIMTFGILGYFFFPYMAYSQLAFYQDVKDDYFL